MRERAYDLAMGYPTHDFTEVKGEIAEGADISDIVHKMTWPFREAYLLLFGSMMDGHAHRELLMAMIAQQLPAPPQPPPGYWPPQPQQEEQDGDEPEDGRKAIFGVKLGGAKQDQQQQQQRKSGRSRRRNR